MSDSPQLARLSRCREKLIKLLTQKEDEVRVLREVLIEVTAAQHAEEMHRHD